jgi:hypothetical protein
MLFTGYAMLRTLSFALPSSLWSLLRNNEDVAQLERSQLDNCNVESSLEN